ncbi:hypothetical protein PHYBLDRAFT_151085 [Phycomyces blakesleeanus NRRL 1555(-)]|uniref:Uncharacterized protein n=1 Tax=Phycomyces blakesleeanus (strain ATCC 8743b / DSM 1359 / FGSC 10004 / NBRC 33097 / NRRL 1555) TaxID=763407 RepID=A0A162TEP3_PHYB8|nr:hypothetical protein PHYBLDRAFT_151085 [Phycomyces blakesleeanus NRRL 1555(-)]OAD68002.1 hypothetical protein PHYBLDRAFT_151085 [Phycomyces blakesleeanus NRRL 1555(-)]|eukprot:XP_018286042.1 hypothetical protein PHYBLDRAFT_151085 [Phycomyces blakesleeanus NRRL 1555(-)]
MTQREGRKFCAKSPIITIDTKKESVEDQPVEEYNWELLDLDMNTMIAASCCTSFACRKALIVYKHLKDEELEEIREAYEKISEMIKPPGSSDSELGKFALFEVSKHIVVKDYFRRLFNNCKKIEASEKAAEIFWTKPSKYHAEAGKHAKRSSIIDDEDLKKKAIVWLRAQKAERQTVVDLKKYLDEMLFPSCLDVKGNVAISTA